MCATKTHPECRRKGEDRRKSDAAPPAGWAERRRSVERRRPGSVPDTVLRIMNAVRRGG